MALTVAQAVTRGRSYILDDDGTRWPDAEFKQHLEHALDGTHSEYITAGGDNFDTYTDLTSTSAGVIDVSALNISQIDGLNAKVSNRFYKVHHAPLVQREYADSEARSFNLQYKQGVQIGTTDSDPLVSTNGTTQANSWADFEHLVCLRAAITACMKDGFIPPALLDNERMMVTRVMKKALRPRARRLSSQSGYYTRWLRYDFVPGTDEILIHRKLVGG